MKLPPPLSRTHLAVLVAVLVVLATAAVLVLSGVVTVSLGILGGTGDPPPQGSFHAESYGENVTFVRDVGGSVDATKLQIRIDDEPQGTWQDLANGADTVERGDRLRVHPGESGAVVALYWTGGGEPRRLVHHTS